jgi:hypothetical protein
VYQQLVHFAENLKECNKYSFIYLSNEQQLKIIPVAQSDLPELFDALSLARRVHEFVADPTHNLQDHFVVSHQFLYLQGPDLYYIYPTTPNVGAPPSETQVKNLAEMMISQGLPFACNTHAQGLGGRLILENFVSPCRDKEAKTTRIPTQLFVRLVRLGAGLSETAKLKSKYPQHQSAIEHIEKTHIRKITVQMITQLGVSLLITYAIERYLNPNLTAKDSFKSIF